MKEEEKRDVIEILKHGSPWTRKKIVEVINQLLEKRSNFSSNLRRHLGSHEQKNYLYDNECYLIIDDRQIELRSEREGTMSANQIIKFEIYSEKDIQAAFEKFVSMTMEDESD